MPLRSAAAETGAARARRTSALRASIHQRLSLDVRFLEGLDAAEEHARAAVDLAEQVGDAALRASALGGLALIELNAGKPGRARARRAGVELVRGAECRRPSRTRLPFAHVLVWSSTSTAPAPSSRASTRTGASGTSAWPRTRSGTWRMVELRTGNYALAEQHARQSRELNGPYVRDEVASPTSLFPLTLIAAHRGDLDARSRARRGDLPVVGAPRVRLHGPRRPSGSSSSGAGSPAAAVDCFRAADEMTDAADGAEPTMQLWRSEQVEALLGLGLVDEAIVRLDAWKAARGGSIAPGRLHTPPAAAASSRRRRLTSRRRWSCLQTPSSSTRRWATRSGGRERSRARRHATAGAGETAGTGGDRAGAGELRGARGRGLGRRTRGELGAIGGRTRSDGLTPAEPRVADLVAEGRTNAEVAATLFLAERTVASHLTHVYAKLGVRSRTELARRL